MNPIIRKYLSETTSLSYDELVRDSCFSSLLLEENRVHVPLVNSVLSDFHHLLRASSSVKYIRSGLDMINKKIIKW